MSPDADRCDLCGTPVEVASDGADESEAPRESDQGTEQVEETVSERESSSEDATPVFCNQCGWKNPPGARYCSQCGEELQDLSDAAPSGTRQVQADLPSGESKGPEGGPRPLIPPPRASARTSRPPWGAKLHSLWEARSCWWSGSFS